MALPIPSLNGRTPFEQVKGWTPDISTMIQFDWYELVYYLDENGQQKLAQWLGPAEDHGSGDLYWLLPVFCRPIVSPTVWNIPEEDIRDPEKVITRTEFDNSVRSKIGDEIIETSEDLEPEFPDSGDLFEEYY